MWLWEDKCETYRKLKHWLQLGTHTHTSNRMQRIRYGMRQKWWNCFQERKTIYRDKIYVIIAFRCVFWIDSNGKLSTLVRFYSCCGVGCVTQQPKVFGGLNSIRRKHHTLSYRQIECEEPNPCCFCHNNHFGLNRMPPTKLKKKKTRFKMARNCRYLDILEAK